MGKKITVTIKEIDAGFEDLFVSKFGSDFRTNIRSGASFRVERINPVPESKFEVITVSGRKLGKTVKAANFPPTITIDSLTTLQKKLMEQIEKEEKKKKKKRKP